MMPLENQLVCQELSMKMKELGFKQESLFYYSRSYSKMMMEDGLFQLLDKEHAFYKPAAMDYKLETISAYTVAELGEVLPDGIMTIKTAMPEGFICIHDNTVEQHREYGLTEADARAKMLIYLKENNLI